MLSVDAGLINDKKMYIISKHKCQGFIQTENRDQKFLKDFFIRLISF